MSIAVVGSGIAGLTCAHVLSPRHEVTLFEADRRLGGHSNTVTVDDPVAGRLGVDTGFIVHNDRNYPNLRRLFDSLGVDTIDTDMSFGVTDAASGIQYRATNPATLLADPRNATRRKFWRMLGDIPRFYRRATQFLDHGDDDTTIGEFLHRNGYSSAFIDLHLVPMGASVWSAAPSDFMEFPARSLFRFLANHGLLSIGDRPQWKAIPGGSRRYVEALIRRFEGTIHLGEPVRSIRRAPEGVSIETKKRAGRFDAVVLACHSDQALKLLDDPDPTETEILGAIRYRPNRAVLHTDVSVMPPARRAWAAWNYHRRGPHMSDATLTYDLTELQRLPGRHRYLVTLNGEDGPGGILDESNVIAAFDYAHPVFDAHAVRAQRRVAEISGINRTHYAGAYWGYGFHEDGMVSGLRVCRELGVDWTAGA